MSIIALKRKNSGLIFRVGILRCVRDRNGYPTDQH
jgi:hypothetical protein